MQNITLSIFYIEKALAKCKCFSLDDVNLLDIRLRRRRNSRKRLVMSPRRYMSACNRIADANVTFCERGGRTARVIDFLCNKKSERSKVRSDVAFTFIIDAIYLRQVLKCSLLFNVLKDLSTDSLVSYTHSFVSSVLCR